MFVTHETPTLFIPGDLIKLIDNNRKSFINETKYVFIFEKNKYISRLYYLRNKPDFKTFGFEPDDALKNTEYIRFLYCGYDLTNNEHFYVYENYAKNYEFKLISRAL